MSKKFHFRHSFKVQHGKSAQALWKSASQHLSHIHWSLPRQLSWRTSLLLTCQILRLLFNTLVSDEKYPVLNRDNLTILIQMQQSQKQNTFSEFFTGIRKAAINFRYFEKKMTLIDFDFPKLRTPETWPDKCLKSSISDIPSRCNMVKVPKHCGSLHHSTFLIFIDHCQVTWVGESVSYWHAKSWDYLLTHWLSMKSILLLIETI